MTYACPPCEFLADTQCNEIATTAKQDFPRTTAKFLRNIQVQDIYNAFQIPYVYDYITKL
jgi:hypothetical protein